LKRCVVVGVGFALDFEGVELALFGFKGAQGGSFFIFVTGMAVKNEML